MRAQKKWFWYNVRDLWYSHARDNVIVQISLILPTPDIDFDQFIVGHHRQIASKTWAALRSEKAFESACWSREEREAQSVKDRWYS